ncbi:MAG: hypothetical protein CME31_22885 [Gimesia sp.]|uniref:DUF4411 domain-containing protein n=1 Tax=Gimesia maris TaxID=122 RepID=A0A3D3R4J3_9PLAN|nr:hypothetical protein [Gimesia sp.]HCO22927.1 hypothetical protein [Gimesia maris]|tara:strand:+ start:12970 stop:13209 length:240 start_codon:yes stop_codon:yes gene_type:complete
MVQWVDSSTQFTQAAKAKFSSNADGWLVAYAKAHDYVVVTREVYVADIKREVKIPNVCEEFDVEYIDTFDLLEELGVQL